MLTDPPVEGMTPTPYGSAKDLPSYRDLAQQIRSGKFVTRFIARDQRSKLIEIEQQLQRLTRVVDDFYGRLGSRNWIFHENLNVDEIEQLLADTTDAETAEARLIELYRDPESTRWWLMRLQAHDGLRQRLHQIERAKEHYEAGQFDSCVLHLIAVMDGFVNDFEPQERMGLHSRQAEDIVAWDSVVGHHLGLTHVMATFTKTIKKRVDDEVVDLYRHGIIHGSVVRFDNVIVATKAWNLLFALADWATATRKAAIPKESPPSWSSTFAALRRQAAYQRYAKDFTPSTIDASDPGFASNEIVVIASEFLGAWERGRWGLVARFEPPALRGSSSDGRAARETKETFERYDLQAWSISSVTADRASTAAIMATATINSQVTELEFRMVFWCADDNVGIPGQDEGTWSVAVWAPGTYLRPADG